MKTTFLTLASLLSVAAASAQVSRGDFDPAADRLGHSVSAQYGVGWFKFANAEQSTLTLEEDGREIELLARVRSSFAPTIAYDYRLGKVFSIGGAVSRQAVRFDRFARADGAGDEGELPESVRLGRTFVSARALFHYGVSERFEMYSGVRAGVTVWSLRVRGGDGGAVGYDELSRTAGNFVLPHVTVIPFGFRAFVSPRVYLGGETMFGSPHFAALQAGVRF